METQELNEQNLNELETQEELVVSRKRPHQRLPIKEPPLKKRRYCKPERTAKKYQANVNANSMLTALFHTECTMSTKTENTKRVIDKIRDKLLKNSIKKNGPLSVEYVVTTYLKSLMIDNAKFKHLIIKIIDTTINAIIQCFTSRTRSIQPYDIFYGLNVVINDRLVNDYKSYMEKVVNPELWCKQKLIRSTRKYDEKVLKKDKKVKQKKHSHK